jgi:uncharacterized membrane protein YfcA
MSQPLPLAIIAATFLLAGGVKGVIGLGLPTVSLALLTATVGLHEAMALMLVPSFVTNLWQALAGPHLGTLLARTGPFMLAATATVWVGALALPRVDVALLSALLGLLLVSYAALSLTRAPMALPTRWQAWAGPLTGTVNGVLTGMTGSFVVPGVPYLRALGLPRDVLVQAMGVLFTLSTAALALSLGEKRLLTAELALVSAAGVVPAVAGMTAGQRLRRRLSERAFHRCFFSALALVGAGIFARSLLSAGS